MLLPFNNKTYILLFGYHIDKIKWFLQCIKTLVWKETNKKLFKLHSTFKAVLINENKWLQLGRARR